MTLTVVAFDPGNSPSACVYRGDASFVLFDPMGVERSITRRRQGDDQVFREVIGKTNTPDIAAILEIYRTWLPDIAVVETVTAVSLPTISGQRKPQGLASTASLMHAAGLLEGIAWGVSMHGGCRLVKIQPKTWRGAWSLPTGKDQSRLMATRLFPMRSRDFKLKKDHNLSDPLLMAMFIWHRETGTALPK